MRLNYSENLDFVIQRLNYQIIFLFFLLHEHNGNLNGDPRWFPVTVRNNVVTAIDAVVMERDPVVMELDAVAKSPDAVVETRVML